MYDTTYLKNRLTDLDEILHRYRIEWKRKVEEHTGYLTSFFA